MSGWVFDCLHFGRTSPRSQGEITRRINLLENNSTGCWGPSRRGTTGVLLQLLLLESKLPDTSYDLEVSGKGRNPGGKRNFWRGGGGGGEAPFPVLAHQCPMSAIFLGFIGDVVAFSVGIGEIREAHSHFFLFLFLGSFPPFTRGTPLSSKKGKQKGWVHSTPVSEAQLGVCASSKGYEYQIAGTDVVLLCADQVLHTPLLTTLWRFVFFPGIPTFWCCIICLWSCRFGKQVVHGPSELPIQGRDLPTHQWCKVFSLVALCILLLDFLFTKIIITTTTTTTTTTIIDEEVERRPS